MNLERSHNLPMLAPGTRIHFTCYLTSDKANDSYVITSSRFKDLLGRDDIQLFINEWHQSWIKSMNGELGVDDFRIMTEAETDAFLYGCHKHNSKEPFHEDPGIRH